MSFSSSSTQKQTRTARMATRQHLSNQTNQVGACFVLNDFSDDPDTSAYIVGQHAPLPTETTEQVPLTPTASAAVDTKDTATFNYRAMDDNDEPWATEADHRTGWNKTFKSGSYRGMLYEIVLRDFSETSCITGQGRGCACKHAHHFSTRSLFRISSTDRTGGRSTSESPISSPFISVSKSQSSSDRRCRMREIDSRRRVRGVACHP